MKTVHVKASREYDVLIGSGLLAAVGSHILELTKAKKVCIISDSVVFPLYGNSIAENLEASGFEVVSFAFPAGEASKNGETYLSLLNFLASNQLTRSDCLVAVGGGVVGDLAGFAAATYLRGIALIQIPTTLLAAVDSSVGGKNAIDLPAGKNLAGTFYQPNLVLCDTDTLQSLPIEIFRDGCSEVIKYGILYDAALLSHLQQHGMDFDREQVITRCVELKRDVVAEDEFDTGSRMRLNLGHTIGHGIELQSNFAISHGKAVSMGIAIVTRSGHINGLCDAATQQQILSVLERFELPVSCRYRADDLARCTLSDKKRSGGIVNLIIPQHIGKCIIKPTPIGEIQSFIEAGL